MGNSFPPYCDTQMYYTQQETWNNNPSHTDNNTILVVKYLVCCKPEKQRTKDDENECATILQKDDFCKVHALGSISNYHIIHAYLLCVYLTNKMLLFCFKVNQ